MPLYYAFLGKDQESYFYAKKYAEDLKKSGEIAHLRSPRIGYSYWKVGKYEEANYYIKQFIKYGMESINLGRWHGINNTANYDLASTYAIIGDKENAFQYLEKFNTRRVYGLWWVIFLKHDPMFNGIREDPRFQKILKDVESKYQAEHERVRKWLVSEGML